MMGLFRQLWVVLLVLSYAAAPSRSFIIPLGDSLWNPLGALRPRGATTCPVPVDEATALKTGDNGRWTHRPRCIHSDDGQQSYCLYTDAKYREGHGISLIVSPQMAASIREAIDTPHVDWNSAKLPQTAGPVITEEGPAYEVFDTEGKGKGLVARRRIRRGEVFMLDFPVVVANWKFVEHVSPIDGQVFLMKSVDQLPSAERILALAHSTGGPMLEDIMRTNACSVHMNDTEPHLGLFAEMSVSARFNTLNSFFFFFFWGRGTIVDSCLLYFVYDSE
jgi:hypothetical protein